jgi:hypothetical protein
VGVAHVNDGTMAVVMGFLIYHVGGGDAHVNDGTMAVVMTDVIYHVGGDVLNAKLHHNPILAPDFCPVSHSSQTPGAPGAPGMTPWGP